MLEVRGQGHSKKLAHTLLSLFYSRDSGRRRRVLCVLVCGCVPASSEQRGVVSEDGGRVGPEECVVSCCALRDACTVSRIVYRAGDEADCLAT
eukprot:2692940-Prymnesium_polylepis.1